MDHQAFKKTMGKFASGVTVVTTEHEGKRFGMTVSAFSSLSLEPPLVLVCIGHGATAREPMLASGKFAIHILAESQLAIGVRFAGMLPDVDDRFEGVASTPGKTGSPILSGCLAYIDRELAHAYDGGDHVIVVGRVMDVYFERREDVRPLIHFERKWRALRDGAIA